MSNSFLVIGLVRTDALKPDQLTENYRLFDVGRVETVVIKVGGPICGLPIKRGFKA